MLLNIVNLSLLHENQLVRADRDVLNSMCMLCSCDGSQIITTNSQGVHFLLKLLPCWLVLSLGKSLFQLQFLQAFLFRNV